MVATDLQPVRWSDERGREDQMSDADGDYFNELRSPDLVKSDHLFTRLTTRPGHGQRSFVVTKIVLMYSADRLFRDEHLEHGGLRDRSTPTTDA